MVVIGIDPGLSGAIAFIERRPGGEIWLEVFDVPVHQIKRGKSAKKELDIQALSNFFDPQIKVVPFIPGNHLHFEKRTWPPTHAFIEQVGAMPGQGVSSMFAFGKVYGAIIACVACHCIPHTLVTPVKWKKAVGVPVGGGASKDGSRARASQLMPQHASLWARAKDDGRAEAALIAYYGLQDLSRAAG
jgi:crossover junction endodeoxyribonuclease RuvC